MSEVREHVARAAEWSRLLASAKRLPRRRGRSPRRPRGRPKNAVHAKRLLAAQLYLIYHQATGRRPTRRFNDYQGRYYGPFRDFLKAAIEPTGLLPPGADVDRLMRDCLYADAGPRRESWRAKLRSRGPHPFDEAMIEVALETCGGDEEMALTALAVVELTDKLSRRVLI